ncbi:hypothetical protein [Frankia sp. AgW1.1]|uniref:hypothetical protein n=1 Tax=Frankia sp. AgW1.1 TaxID=1836971 RepID=UPI001934A466|nr:hypothetical protein [Frankia sp. AgW1.1]MBL7487047.1 hypothetical protein [Frankia sp. AgW1.1]
MFTIRYSYIDRDWSHTQVVTVLKDGQPLVEINTQADCPEDNTVSRLHLPGFAVAILAAAGVANVETVSEVISQDEWMERGMVPEPPGL